jgi:uncharacterized membrane protein
MHKQLEEYLNTFAARLGKLPGAQRDDELREIRQHLELLIASHREQGKSEEEAVGLRSPNSDVPRKSGVSLARSAEKVSACMHSPRLPSP